MFYSGLLKIVTIVTGIFVAGEAVALLIGMYILSPRPNSWISGRNTFLIVVDILCGAGLFWLILTYSNGQREGWLLTVVLFSLGAHAYREWEFFASSAPSRFLANLPLFAVNNVKLVGLILICGIILSSFFARRG